MAVPVDIAISYYGFSVEEAIYVIVVEAIDMIFLQPESIYSSEELPGGQHAPIVFLAEIIVGAHQWIGRSVQAV